jgi:NADH-quinone oxidoreductase subunit N
VFLVAFEPFSADWQPYVYVLAVATMLVGSVLAVVQTDIKRMLAYSSINHAGFILIGVQAASSEGISSALFYLAAYTFMVVGSFGVVTVLTRKGDTGTTVEDYKGLSAREPVLAFVFAIFLFAQAGVPLTSGFFAKFYVLRAAIEANSWPLAIVAMLSAVIAAFLYLRIVVAMYMSTEEAEEGEEPEPAPARVPRVAVPFAAKLALGVAFAFTLAVGFLPSSLADASTDATPTVTAPPK